MEFGADEVVDYTAVRFEEAVDKVDVVVNFVGDGANSTGAQRDHRPSAATSPSANPIGCVSLAMTQFGYKHSVSCPASAELRPVLASFDHA